MSLLDHILHSLFRLLQIIRQDILIQLVLAQLLIVLLPCRLYPLIRSLASLDCRLDGLAPRLARRWW